MINVISVIVTIVGGCIMLAATIIAVSVAIYTLADYVDRILPGKPEDWWLE